MKNAHFERYYKLLSKEKMGQSLTLFCSKSSETLERKRNGGLEVHEVNYLFDIYDKFVEEKCDVESSQTIEEKRKNNNYYVYYYEFVTLFSIYLQDERTEDRIKDKTLLTLCQNQCNHRYPTSRDWELLASRFIFFLCHLPVHHPYKLRRRGSNGLYPLLMGIKIKNP